MLSLKEISAVIREILKHFCQTTIMTITTTKDDAKAIRIPQVFSKHSQAKNAKSTNLFLSLSTYRYPHSGLETLLQQLFLQASHQYSSAADHQVLNYCLDSSHSH